MISRDLRTVNLYSDGLGVEMDKEKERYHLEVAAIGGHPKLDTILGYIDGYVSKEDFAVALRAHQAAVDATKSPQRQSEAAGALEIAHAFEWGIQRSGLSAWKGDKPNWGLVRLLFCHCMRSKRSELSTPQAEDDFQGDGTHASSAAQLLALAVTPDLFVNA
ncbi:hypothetical protein QTG54_011686 [Skeletonema marinoi]|uniref:Uncharacterized protein n=1 Tax=Skeletonema marinoi TaxID=267567 RepID=A0AAD9D946_9STRA|nr:hypothetical protein QTG54_011686 [Skeletonema marinoi]